ncbi:hypothetical protein CY35_19G016100 [Sphagnum magellanicum]|nr:hypothetical protein CY35_19G016100 [Sphagnum magellanicum]
MEINTVRVSNVSPRATEHDIQDFFSFSGEIEHVELHKHGELSRIAFVTFKEPQAVDTALLLSGATIVDQAVTISPAEDSDRTATSAVPIIPNDPYPPEPVSAPTTATNRAQDVLSNMLAKGFVLGNNAIARVKALDEKHQITANASQISANASAQVASIDKKIGITQKFTAGSAAVNQQVKAVDEKFQVTEKTRTALLAAEQKINSAGSAIAKNRYVLSGATWVTGAYARVAKTAGEVGHKAMEKVAIFGTDEQKHGQHVGSPHEPHGIGSTYTPPPPYPAENAAIALSSAAESTIGRYPSISLGYDQAPSVNSASEAVTKPPPAQGLVL